MRTSKSTHFYSMHASRMKLLRQEFSGRLSCLRNSQYVEYQYRNDLTQILKKSWGNQQHCQSHPPSFWGFSVRESWSLDTSDEVLCAWWAVVYWDYREACGLIACVKFSFCDPSNVKTGFMAHILDRVEQGSLLAKGQTSRGSVTHWVIWIWKKNMNNLRVIAF